MNDHHVIFGTGPVGKATARILLQQGHRVTLVNRSGHADGIPAAAVVVRGDAYDVQQVRQLTNDATTVYQCAQPAYHQWEHQFPALQAAIVEGVAANHGKLVVMENLYGYGNHHGQAMTERTPYAAHTRKGKVRAAMSESLFAAHASGRLRVATARASNFYGPEYLLFAEQLIYPALQGKAANALGNVDVPHTFTYVPDVGATMAILGTTSDGDGQAWHVPSAPAITQRELLTKIYSQAGTPLKFRTANTLVIWLMGRFVPALAETVEMMYEWKEPFIMDSCAFTQQFGLQPTPLDTAINTTVAWFRAHQPRHA